VAKKSERAPTLQCRSSKPRQFDANQSRRLIAVSTITSCRWSEAVAWRSIVKTAGCFLGGGALMGLLRGSTTSGVLAGFILFALFLAVAVAVIIVDRAGRRAARRDRAMQKQQRELAGGSVSAPLS
jgi:hypothetical protein